MICGLPFKCKVAINASLIQELVQEMSKTARIDLIGVPWPVNLLKCCRYTGEMQPGDEMVISVIDEDVKDSLLLILNAMPDFSFDISDLGLGFAINVTKKRSGVSTKKSDLSGAK